MQTNKIQKRAITQEKGLGTNKSCIAVLLEPKQKQDAEMSLLVVNNEIAYYFMHKTLMIGNNLIVGKKPKLNVLI